MVRSLGLIIAVALLNLPAFSQIKIGVKFNPGITTTRLESGLDTLSIDNSYNALRFLGGIVIEKEFNENYNFATGIMYMPKKTGIVAHGPNSNFDEELNIQYLVIPLSLKLYTNEVGLDKRVYFQLGSNLEVKIHDTLDEIDNQLILKTNFMDVSIFLSSGMEFFIGRETALFAGLSYQRGLLNQFTDTGNAELRGVIDFISVDLGVKF